MIFDLQGNAHEMTSDDPEWTYDNLTVKCPECNDYIVDPYPYVYRMDCLHSNPNEYAPPGCKIRCWAFSMFGTCKEGCENLHMCPNCYRKNFFENLSVNYNLSVYPSDSCKIAMDITKIPPEDLPYCSYHNRTASKLMKYQ